MIKYILILGLIASFNANAWESCGTDARGNTANCEYQIDDDGTLTIRGVGDNGNIGNWQHDVGVKAPWRGQNVSKIVIEDSIKDLGSYGFYVMNIESPINIPSSVTSISASSFDGIRVPQITIGEGVKTIDNGAFYHTIISTIVIPESVTSIGSSAFSDFDASPVSIVLSDKTTDIAQGAFDLQKISNIYCSGNFNTCKANIDLALENKIIPYEKEGGVYILNGKYYLSGADMASNTNECSKELNECKRDVLEAKGICQDADCDTFIQSDGNYMLKYNGKTYQSINDLLKGNYDKRRIYTLEEANFVAGEKNTIRIRYR